MMRKVITARMIDWKSDVSTQIYSISRGWNAMVRQAELREMGVKIWQRGGFRL
ncbi:hypothetical protein ACVXHB_30120 [Escherichia coli]